MPKWVCAFAIGVSTAALVVQAIIDIDQGTTGMELFSRPWFAQAWQMSLITLCIILAVAFGGRYLGHRAYMRALGLYAVAFFLMVVTVLNGADFIADNSLAERAAQANQEAQAKGVAEQANSQALEEHKEALANLWRTYAEAKTPADKAKILAQIKELQAPVLIVPLSKPARAGSGTIWNRWLGWRPESIQEYKAVSIPVLIMLCKTIFLTLGFAYWPSPEAVREAKTKVAFRPNLKRYEYEDARSDIVALIVTGELEEMDATASDFARKWGRSDPTAGEWIRLMCQEKLVIRKRSGRGNRLVVKPAPKSNVVPLKPNGGLGAA